MELASHYYIAELYMQKFAIGADGADASKRNTSPSYTGERQNTWPKYAPYTRDSLEKAIRAADALLNLPPKDHFTGLSYRISREVAQVIKDAAEALPPWHQNWRALLNDPACSDDLPRCDEYGEVKSEGVEIYTSMREELNSLYPEMGGR